MRNMPNREVVRQIEKAGWYLARVKGGHRQFKHPERKGLVTISKSHKTLCDPVLKSIEAQAGIVLK